jgi:uncharacterized protein (TIGR02246 family)
MRRLLFCLPLLCLGSSSTSFGQEAAPAVDEEPQVRETGKAYVEAFNRGDAAALADFWSPDAVYTNRITGEQVVGRAAIAEQFKTLFAAQKDLKLAVDVESIRFLSPNVAVENGTARFAITKDDAEEVRYGAVYVKSGGKWLLDRVNDEEPDTATPYEQLKVLEWLVGRWVDQDENVRIETECNWAKNQNFLVRSFTVEAGGQVDMSGMQVIGWDAAEKRIRSWTFDSDGGFAEAVWSKKGDQWFVSNKGVLADGTKATMVNVIKPVDADSFTWQTIERTVGGALLPNIAEVLIVRE